MTRAAIFVCSFFVALRFCYAQPAATILGRVVDPTGAVVAGATVSVHNADTGLDRATVTTGTGDYELLQLPIAGLYSLRVSKPGFQTQEFTGIEVRQVQAPVTLVLGAYGVTFWPLAKR